MSPKISRTAKHEITSQYLYITIGKACVHVDIERNYSVKRQSSANVASFHYYVSNSFAAEISGSAFIGPRFNSLNVS